MPTVPTSTGLESITLTQLLAVAGVIVLAWKVFGIAGEFVTSKIKEWDYDKRAKKHGMGVMAGDASGPLSGLLGCQWSPQHEMEQKHIARLLASQTEVMSNLCRMTELNIKFTEKKLETIDNEIREIKQETSRISHLENKMDRKVNGRG